MTHTTTLFVSVGARNTKVETNSFISALNAAYDFVAHMNFDATVKLTYLGSDEKIKWSNKAAALASMGARIADDQSKYDELEAADEEAELTDRNN